MNGNDHNHELNDELLSAYIDGELTDSERAMVEAQLASDPEAQHLLHQLRSVSQDVQALPLKPAPRDLRDQVWQRIEKKSITREATGASAPTPEVRTTTTPLAFQGRRPWIWASLAIAAGLMIMFLQRGNNDRENLAVATKNERGRVELHDPLPQRSLGLPENEPAAAAVDPTMVAKSESFDTPAALEGPAPSAAMPPANVAEPSGQVASSGRRLDESSSISAGAPAAPQGRAALNDMPSDEAIREGAVVLTSPSPPPAPAPSTPAPSNRSGVAASAPAAPPAATPATPSIGALAKGEVNGQAGPAMPGAAPDQLADRQKPRTTTGAFAGGGGGIGGAAKEQSLERSETQTPTLVVHVVAKKYALDNKAFEDLLAKNHIQLESNASTLAFEDSRRAGGAVYRSSKTAEADRFARQPAEKPSAGEQFEFLEVEAPQQSIVSCLTELKQDSANYAGVSIENAAVSTESNAKTDSAPADKKLVTDLSLYARGVVPQTQKDAVPNQFYAYRESNEPSPTSVGEAASTTSELRASGKSDVDRKKLETEQLKEAKSPSPDQLTADKSTLGRARRVDPTEIQLRGLGRISTSDGAKPRDEDVVKRLQAPVALDALAQQKTGNLRVLFVIGEEPSATSSAPASEKSK